MKWSQDRDRNVNVSWPNGEQLTQGKESRYLGSLSLSDGKCKKDICSPMFRPKDDFNLKNLVTYRTVLLKVKTYFIIALYGVLQYVEFWSEILILVKEEKVRLNAFKIWSGAAHYKYSELAVWQMTKSCIE